MGRGWCVVKEHKFDKITNYCKDLAFSWSSCETFSVELGGCKRKYWFSRNPETKDLQEKGDPLNVGVIFHDYAEEYAKTVRLGKLHDEWVHDKREMLILRKELTENGAKDLAFLINTFSRNNPFPMEGAVEFEMQLSIDEDFNPTSWFKEQGKTPPFCRAKIDMHYITEYNDEGLPKSVRMVDWKTGRVKEPQLIQLQVYAMMLHCLYPTLESFSVGLYFVRDNEFIDRNLGLPDVEAAKKWLIDKAAEIRSCELFEAAPNANCGYCGWAKYCKAHEEIDTSTPAGRLAALAQARGYCNGWVKSVKADMKDFEDGIVKSDNCFAYMKKYPGKRVVNDVFGLLKLVMAAEGIDDELQAWKKIGTMMVPDNKSKALQAYMENDDPIISALVDSVCEVTKDSTKFTIENYEKQKELPVALPAHKPDVVVETGVLTEEDIKAAVEGESFAVGSASDKELKAELERLRKEKGLAYTNQKSGFIFYVLGGKYKSVRGCKTEDLKRVIHCLNEYPVARILELAKKGINHIHKDIDDSLVQGKQESGELPASGDTY
jgi:CRISPR/Cas system-associated exonuclease Cas4 (RecB family)